MSDAPQLPKESAVPVVPGAPDVSAMAVPDPKKLEHKELLERLAQMGRERQEEHQKFNREIQRLQTQAKVDLERLRATTANHVTDLEKQVQALTRGLARLQGEVDRLERENLTLRVMAAQTQVPVSPPPPVPVPGNGGISMVTAAPRPT